MHPINNIYFWKANEPNGWLSNWYKSRFLLDGRIMRSSEHAFIYLKAKTFNPNLEFFDILNEADPAKVKKIGRMIPNFNEDVWVSKRENVMLVANYYKYIKNPMLMKNLLDTYPHRLIEASPLDNIWGSGIDKFEHARREASGDFTFPGLNLLGKVLTKLRNDIYLGNSRLIATSML